MAIYERMFTNSQLEEMQNRRIPDLIKGIRELEPEFESDDSRLCNYAYDIHIRRNSELMVYHGGTCLLTIGFTGIEKGGISFKSKSYGRGRGCDDEFSRLKNQTRVEDINLITDLVCAFLTKIVEPPKSVADKFFRNMTEGYWSSRLSIEYGRGWKPGREWMIIDREAVLDFKNEGFEAKTSFHDKFNRQAQEIKHGLQKGDAKRGGRATAMNGGSGMRNFGNELDFLALGLDRQLVCIELKHGSNTAGICWGPLQAAVYRDAFEEQLCNSESITESIKTMVKQKVALGLLPPDASDLLPENSFSRVEGVLAIAGINNHKNGKCWRMAVDVNRELSKPVRMIRSDDGLNWEDPSCWK